MTTDPIVPDHIRAAIHAGHVGQVVIFCDRCGIEETADYTGETREARFAAARANLANNKGWAITEAQDLCPKCNVPDQPDGIDEQTHDLPDPARSAERVGEYIKASGDGLYDVQDGNPLYGRDLEALTRVPTKLADVQAQLANTIHTLDLVRRELGATREEADRFAAERDHQQRRAHRFMAAAPAADHAHRQLRAIRKLYTDHADGPPISGDWLMAQLRELTQDAPDAPPLVPGSSRRAPEPKAGDRVEDGDMMGTLVRCEMCGGSGLLHQPDELPETAAPKLAQGGIGERPGADR